MCIRDSLHTTHSAGYPWQVVRSSWTGPQYSVPTTDRKVPLRGWVTEDACRKLVALAGRSLDDLVRSANQRDFRPVPLGIGVSAAFDSRIERTRTSNVLALLPGSDPKLSSEVVLYTAHPEVVVVRGVEHHLR